MSDDDSKKVTEIKSENSPKKEEDASEQKEDSEKPSDDEKMADPEDKAKAKEDSEKKAEEERKRKEELKKKYANWPLRGIKDPHDNDVMYGRGGGTNHHSGNKRYRQMVEDRKVEYVNSKRLDKPLVALGIIRLWRAQLPPGRFLKLDEKTGHWNDVGDKKAREKTSQALREKAPLIRKQQEDEKTGKDGEGEDGKPEEGTKSTRFAAGTKEESSSKSKKPVLARDHSLGREYLDAGESVSLEGFSWQDPFQADSSKRTSSYGPGTSPSRSAPPAAYPPAGRMSSNGSLGIAPPHHGPPPGPPPPPDYYGNTSAIRSREYSSGGRFDSWGTPFAYPPPPPPPAVHGPTHQRSGSWSQAPIPPPAMPRHQRSGSWNGRDHSLAFNPLIGASVAQAADRNAFGDRGPYGGRPSSGYWSGPYRSPPPHHTSPTNSTPSPSPGYNVDMDIARSWSGGAEGAARSWSMEPPPPQYGHPQPVHGGDTSPMRDNGGTLPRPQIVKRDTSHQNENVETKHKVKRAALNRDNSLASNTLKQQYMPEYYNKQFNSEQEVKSLSDNLEQSTLSSSKTQTSKPEPVSESGRVTTLDIITSDLMAVPAPLKNSDRVSTIEALGIDFNSDPIIDPKEIELENPIENAWNDTKKGGVPKPSAMTADSRITTNDFNAIISSSLDDDDPLQLADEPPPLNQETIAESWLAQS